MKKKILIIMPHWIGDVVMSLPFLEKARKVFIEDSIKILIRKDIYPLIEENCSLLDILPLLYSEKSVKETYKIILKVRNEKFEKCFILPRSYRMFLTALLSNIREKYGYGDLIKKFFYKKYLKRDKKALMQHRVFYYLNILKLDSRVDDDNIYPELKLNGKRVDWAENLIKNAGFHKKIIIGINPGATYGEAKCWGIENFNKLIEKINSIVEGCGILIFGGKDNLEYNSAIKGKNVLNLTGKLNLPESASLISKCSVFITNDTGPMHIADALGVNVVAIFGPTDPRETPPFRMNKHIIYKGLDCSPCKERICPLKHHKCMLKISVKNVFEEIKKILEELNA